MAEHYQAVAVAREKVSGAGLSTSRSRGKPRQGLRCLWGGQWVPWQGCNTCLEQAAMAAGSWVVVGEKRGQRSRGERRGLSGASQWGCAASELPGDCLELELLAGAATSCTGEHRVLPGDRSDFLVRRWGERCPAGSESREGCLSRRAGNCSPGAWGFRPATFVPQSTPGGVVVRHLAAGRLCCVCQCVLGGVVFVDSDAWQLRCSRARAAWHSLAYCRGPPRRGTRYSFVAGFVCFSWGLSAAAAL